MKTAEIKIRGWKTETETGMITFERGDWFCIARFCDVFAIAKQYKKDGWNDNGAYACAAREIVKDWIKDGAPVVQHSETFNRMVDAIVEAVKNN